MYISRNEKLRRVSDDTYVSSKPETDGSRALKWRRSFNVVNFHIKNVRAETLLSVNDTDLNLDDVKDRSHWSDVKPEA